MWYHGLDTETAHQSKDVQAALLQQIQKWQIELSIAVKNQSALPAKSSPHQRYRIIHKESQWNLH